MSSLLVLSTASSLKEARKIADILLSKRLAACVNISPSLESHYWWKGKKEKAKEVLLLIKTRKTHFTRLEKAIRRHHSYSVPEIIAVPIIHGSQPYLQWLGGELGDV